MKESTASRIAWAFAPPYPKELTLARRTGNFGHGVLSVTIEIRPFFRST